MGPEFCPLFGLTCRENSTTSCTASPVRGGGRRRDLRRRRRPSGRAGAPLPRPAPGPPPPPPPHSASAPPPPGARAAPGPFFGNPEPTPPRSPSVTRPWKWEDAAHRWEPGIGIVCQGCHLWECAALGTWAWPQKKHLHRVLICILFCFVFSIEYCFHEGAAYVNRNIAATKFETNHTNLHPRRACLFSPGNS